MSETENITSETTLDAKELSQLVARLSNPTQSPLNNAVRIKDVAETLDIQEEDVIRELARLREDKKSQPVPIEAERFAEVLSSFKTPVEKSFPRGMIVPLLVFLVIGIALLALLFFWPYR